MDKCVKFICVVLIIRKVCQAAVGQQWDSSGTAIGQQWDSSRTAVGQQLDISETGPAGACCGPE